MEEIQKDTIKALGEVTMGTEIRKEETSLRK